MEQQTIEQVVDSTMSLLGADWLGSHVARIKRKCDATNRRSYASVLTLVAIDHELFYGGLSRLCNSDISIMYDWIARQIEAQQIKDEHVWATYRDTGEVQQ